MKLRIILLIISISNLTFSQGLNYNAILDSMKSSVDAVILSETYDLEILDETESELFYKTKILIFNQNADDYCREVLRESKFVEIDDFDARLRYLNGGIIKELESDDIHEGEASFGSFYNGHNYTWFKLTHHTYPFIFEFEKKLEYNSLFFWPSWFPKSKLPTYHSSYTLKIPDEINFSYFPIDLGIEPSVEKNENSKTYFWELKNIPKWEDEDYMSPDHYRKMGIIFKAENFILDDYNGSTKSWSDFANFYNTLTENRYVLPDEAKKEIKEITKGISDEKEKVEVLYKYLQKSNRYLDIEIGISGWQPQSAADVFKNRYGDCKDLSTFMVSSLREVGIKAYPALALTRNKGSVYEEFPSSQFNHCITMVELSKDTLWLECTDSYSDYDNMPYTIEDINALVVNESGGEIIRTPKKSAEENLSVSKILGEITPEGNLAFTSKISTYGNRKKYFISSFAVKNTDEKIEFLQNVLDDNFSNVSISNYSTTPDNQEKNFNIEIEGNYSRFIPKLSKRIFLNPNIYNRLTDNFLPEEKVDERKSAVYFNYPYKDMDSVVIKIPRNYIVESLPDTQNIKTPFGNFYATYEIKLDKIIYNRELEILENEVPLENYSKLIDFFDSVIKSDKKVFVLKRQ